MFLKTWNFHKDSPLNYDVTFHAALRNPLPPPEIFDVRKLFYKLFNYCVCIGCFRLLDKSLIRIAFNEVSRGYSSPPKEFNASSKQGIMTPAMLIF